MGVAQLMTVIAYHRKPCNLAIFKQRNSFAVCGMFSVEQGVAEGCTHVLGWAVSTSGKSHCTYGV